MTVPTDPHYTDAELDAALTDDTTDPEAPFGRKLDGTPKRGRGGRPAGKAGRARRGAGSRPAVPMAAPASAPPRPTTARRKPVARGTTDYRPGIVGLIAIPATILNFFNPLDAAALLMGAEEFAEAVNETAKDRAEVAAVCERMLQVGPYGAIIAALVKPAAQIAENHGLLPTEMTTRFGAVPRDQLMAHLGVHVAEQAAKPEQETSVEAAQDQAA